jgi:hypothetical protein
MAQALSAHKAESVVTDKYNCFTPQPLTFRLFSLSLSKLVDKLVNAVKQMQGAT